MTGRTELLELMKRIRDGLRLRTDQYKTTHYSASGIVTELKFEDGKTYRITIEELRNAKTSIDLNIK